MINEYFRYKSICLVILLCNLSFLNAQSGNGKFCVDAEPLCGSSQFSYTNASGVNFAENTPDYGCLILQLNPSWFYLQIAENGNIQLQIQQSTAIGGFPDLDVDFIAYGPFKDPSLPCASKLTASNIVDCSYTINFVEYLDIVNANAGDYYLLMITNFSRKSGFITVTQTAGAATTNCNFFNPVIKTTQEACAENNIALNASHSSASKYVWYAYNQDTDEFDFINESVTSIKNVITSNVYRAEVLNSNNVLLDTYEFDVRFYDTPNVPLNINYEICDTVNDNDGIAQFDLSLKNIEVLDGLNSDDFSVTYYSNISDAEEGNDNILPFLYTNKEPRETIYVRVENNLSTSIDCYDVGEIHLIVNMLPNLELEDDYILCVNLNGTEEIQVPVEIDTKLSIEDYSFIWYLDDEIIPSESGSKLIPSIDGNYSVEVTDKDTFCSIITSTYVQVSELPKVSAEVITYAFIESNNIEVTATGIGVQEYEYQIDNGVWQTGSVFEDVSIGEHLIKVRNLSGCGKTSLKIIVMDYPLYFTPNGDGTNDVWNIVGLQNQPTAKVYIYDRYGKLLKQLGANTSGWDGTFNGYSLPADDYWFTIEYLEPLNNQYRIFKAHFSLVR